MDASMIQMGTGAALGSSNEALFQTPNPAPARAEGASTHSVSDARAGQRVLEPLGAMLLQRQFITAEQLQAAIEQQKLTGRRLGNVLVSMGFTTPDAVLGARSLQLGVPAARLNGYTVHHDAVSALPEKVARK